MEDRPQYIGASRQLCTKTALHAPELCLEGYQITGMAMSPAVPHAYNTGRAAHRGRKSKALLVMWCQLAKIWAGTCIILQKALPLSRRQASDRLLVHYISHMVIRRASWTQSSPLYNVE